MITKEDCLLLLAELKDLGIDTNKQTIQVLKNGVSLDIIKFINDNREMQAYSFYEKLRKSYNNKKSKLYWNIVHEIEEPKDVLTTLGSMSLQILLFMKNVDDPDMFLRHMRFDEIQKCMLNYYNTHDLIPCVKLIQLFKADLKVFESWKPKKNEI